MKNLRIFEQPRNLIVGVYVNYSFLLLVISGLRNMGKRR